MNVGVLGTGMVGEAIGSAIVRAGHSVKMGSRSANHAKGLAWVAKNGPKASLGTFAEAAAFGEILFNCTHGVASLNALKLAGAANLKGKVLIDIANPLDFSHGMPPSLTVCNTDSLAEQIQRAFPETKVVKTLNTMSCSVMVRPSLIADGDHSVFVSGNDPKSKQTAVDILTQWFGWKEASVIDLGDITTARGTEMMLPLWLSLYGKLQSSMYQIKVVR